MILAAALLVGMQMPTSGVSYANLFEPYCPYTEEVRDGKCKPIIHVWTQSEYQIKIIQQQEYNEVTLDMIKKLQKITAEQQKQINYLLGRTK